MTRVRTASGRNVPGPTFRPITNERRARAACKAVHAWLVDTARDEARARSDEWNAMRYDQMNPTQMSVADVDDCNLYLFGTVEGILLTATPPAPSRRGAP